MLTDRFLSKVKREGECLVWTGALKSGYGIYRDDDGRTVRAHRYAYEKLVGPILDGLVLDHICRNKCCVRVDHLEPVSQAENVRRHFRLTTACVHGHPYMPENTYVAPNGRRGCRTCNRLKAAARKRRLVAVDEEQR